MNRTPICRLLNSEDWDNLREKFRQQVPISKQGKLFKPTIELQFRDLEPKKLHVVSLEYVPIIEGKLYGTDINRELGLSEIRALVLNSTDMYVHPHGPFFGHQLMENTLVFDDVKVTTSADSDPRYIVLQPNIMYQIVIQITPFESLSSQYDYDVNSMVMKFEELRFKPVRRISRSFSK
ncbi:MAG: T-box transcription factor tbx20 [Marteilia pararefringens]